MCASTSHGSTLRGWRACLAAIAAATAMLLPVTLATPANAAGTRVTQMVGDGSFAFGLLTADGGAFLLPAGGGTATPITGIPGTEQLNAVVGRGSQGGFFGLVGDSGSAYVAPVAGGAAFQIWDVQGKVISMFGHGVGRFALLTDAGTLYTAPALAPSQLAGAVAVTGIPSGEKVVKVVGSGAPGTSFGFLTDTGGAYRVSTQGGTARALTSETITDIAGDGSGYFALIRDGALQTVPASGGVISTVTGIAADLRLVSVIGTGVPLSAGTSYFAALSEQGTLHMAPARGGAATGVAGLPAGDMFTQVTGGGRVSHSEQFGAITKSGAAYTISTSGDVLRPVTALPESARAVSITGGVGIYAHFAVVTDSGQVWVFPHGASTARLIDSGTAAQVIGSGLGYFGIVSATGIPSTASVDGGSPRSITGVGAVSIISGDGQGDYLAVVDSTGQPFVASNRLGTAAQVNGMSGHRIVSATGRGWNLGYFAFLSDAGVVFTFGSAGGTAQQATGITGSVVQIAGSGSIGSFAALASDGAIYLVARSTGAATAVPLPADVRVSSIVGNYSYYALLTTDGQMFTLLASGGTPTPVTGLPEIAKVTAITGEGRARFALTTDQGAAFTVPVTGGEATPITGLDGAVVTAIFGIGVADGHFGLVTDSGQAFTVPVAGGAVSAISGVTDGIVAMTGGYGNSAFALLTTAGRSYTVASAGGHARAIEGIPLAERVTSITGDLSSMDANFLALTDAGTAYIGTKSGGLVLPVQHSPIVSAMGVGATGRWFVLLSGSGEVLLQPSGGPLDVRSVPSLPERVAAAPESEPTPSEAPSEEPPVETSPAPTTPPSSLPGPAMTAPGDNTPVGTSAPGITAASLRVGGEDRYATAVAVSREVFPSGPVPVVYVATGAEFADALAGSAAATMHEGPLLLVRKDTIPALVVEELDRLQPEVIIIQGGTAAISQAVEDQLREFAAEVQRNGGADRYETAQLTAGSADIGGFVMLATGATFPDALSAGSLYSSFPGPVLLTEPEHGLSPELATILRRLAPTRVFVLGGPAAVSERVDADLGGLGFTVTRLGGADRYATSSAVAEWVRATVGYGTESVTVTGRDFPDGLTAGVLAGHRNAPVLLSDGVCWRAHAQSFLQRLDPRTITVIGGSTLAESLMGLSQCVY